MSAPKVSINGFPLDVEVLEVTLERVSSPSPYDFPIDEPTVKGQISGVVDLSALEALLGPRKLLVEFNLTEQVEVLDAFHPSVPFTFGGTQWKVYRRDFKRHRVFMREVKS